MEKMPAWRPWHVSWFWRGGPSGRGWAWPAWPAGQLLRLPSDRPCRPPARRRRPPLVPESDNRGRWRGAWGGCWQCGQWPRGRPHWRTAAPGTATAAPCTHNNMTKSQNSECVNEWIVMRPVQIYCTQHSLQFVFGTRIRILLLKNLTKFKFFFSKFFFLICVPVLNNSDLDPLSALGSVWIWVNRPPFPQLPVPKVDRPTLECLWLSYLSFLTSTLRAERSYLK